MKLRESVMLIFAAGLVVTVGLLALVIQTERQRAEVEQARNEELEHQLSEARRTIRETLEKLSDERNARATVEQDLLKKDDVLKKTRASFFQQLGDMGKQKDLLNKQLYEHRRLLQIEQDRVRELDLGLTDKTHALTRMEEELERMSKRVQTLQSEIERMEFDQVRIAYDNEKVPLEIVNAFRGRLVSQGLSSLWGTVRYLGDGYYGAFFRTLMMDPSFIRQTYLTNRDASVWYDKTSVELYFRDRYGARAEFDTFDMSLLDEMIMWTLTRLEGNGKGLYVIRRLDDIQGIDKSKVPPDILSLNMEIVKRRWRPDGKANVEQEIIFYCYSRDNGVLLRNRILFDDNGRIKDLESTPLAFDLGNYFYPL